MQRPPTMGRYDHGAGEPPVVDVHWTSGWDSTYRVLDLVHSTTAIVQPWYVIDPIRPSAPLEMRAMDEIRARLAGRHPELAARIRPTVLYERAAIPDMPEVTAMWRVIRSWGRFGKQYDWLSCMARHEGLTRLEMGLHDQHLFFNVVIVRNSEWKDTPYGPILELKEQVDEPAIELFRPFAWPLMGMTKIYMGEAAKRKGFADLMEMTWFCAEPTRRGRACGMCNPCQQVIGERLSRRMPLFSRIKGQAHRRVLGISRAMKKRRRARERARLAGPRGTT